MEQFLEVNNLAVSFGDKNVFHNVNLNLTQGEILGLVGNNGAGKTTLLRVLAGLLQAKTGEVKFADKKIKIGVMIESPGLFRDMSAYENLKAKALCMGYHYGDGELDDLLALVGLEDVGNKWVLKFSMGMKQRLGLALALLGRPELLILDEPINGLDPQGIHEMRKILMEVNQKYGTTMIISSHILDELEKMATTFCFLHDKRIIKQISKKEMLIERGEKPIDEYYIEVLEKSRQSKG